MMHTFPLCCPFDRPSSGSTGYSQQPSLAVNSPSTRDVKPLSSLLASNREMLYANVANPWELSKVTT
ncbi:unnamed protein product [Protopolystoma xenopodis]|uniref:Uncharacterized protein n=1 Tax=Protopolystoma xenopodis TaxID=117903 RepID=A0A3S5ASI2_9PLAT|nr:unnamed protein product [Protopolystoma xenopodis]